MYTTHLVTPAFSATAIAASSATVSTSGLRGRKEDVRKLSMSRGERTLEMKSTNIKSILPPRPFRPKVNLPRKERHLGSNKQVEIKLFQPKSKERTYGDIPTKWLSPSTATGVECCSLEGPHLSQSSLV